MQAQQYANRYTQAQVTSVDRKQLLLLDGGLTFLRRARAGLAAGNLNEYAENLRRAQAVISELLSTLDHEAGGQIAADLARLYEFMLFHLTEGNAKKSVQHLDDVERVLATVADAYHQIIDGRPATVGGAVA
jgi:flagellar secretion chaperone FliS